MDFITKDMVEAARLDIPVKFGPIGEKVYRRSYSRTQKNGQLEDWYVTCARVVNGNCSYVPEHFIEKDEPEKLFKLMLRMEVVPAGRHLWATGIGSNKDFLNNCFSASYSTKFSEHFEFTFMRLMEGGGVGANYSNLFINSRDGNKPWAPKAKINLHLVCHPSHADYNNKVQLDQNEGLELHVDFSSLLSQSYDHNWDPQVSNGTGSLYLRVEDSREGWAESLTLLLESAMDEKNHGRDLVIDVSNVRPRGAMLKGFGGKASGPDALMLLLIRTNRLLNNSYYESLTSLDFMKIDHYIAQAVVSGGTRRSSRMAQKYWKDPDILEFISCKTTSANMIPAHWTTNISVVIDNKFIRALKRKDPQAEEVYDAIITGMKVNGEPGLVNASKCLEGEPPNVQYYCTNPCGEIPMVQYPDLLCFDVCCLGHINLERIEHPEEAFRLITRFLIRATFAPILDLKQKLNVERNRRIGVGFLGYHSWLVKHKIKFSDAPSNDTVRSFFKRMYQIVDTEAKKYCHQLRIPESIKKTTIAPTGSIGQVVGCTTGCQPVFSKFYIRRVRYSNTDSELAALKAEGKYTIEDDLYAANTSVVEFVQVDPIFDLAYETYKKDFSNFHELSEQEIHDKAYAAAIELVEDQGELGLEDFLATQRMLQKEFVDNSISLTINVDSDKYTKEEIKETLKHFLPDLKGTTLFPEFSMKQMPYERLTYDEFMERQNRGQDVERGQAEIECANGVCPIR